MKNHLLPPDPYIPVCMVSYYIKCNQTAVVKFLKGNFNFTA